MTFLGKVLVVTLLIFSVVFMAFAGAVYSRQQTARTLYDKEKAAQSLGMSERTLYRRLKKLGVN